MKRLRIGTRGSALARAQAGHVASLLGHRLPDLRVEVVVISVSGDGGRNGQARGPAPADKRRWVDAIEDALLDRSIDLAVHSAKDVPGALADGLELLGAPGREDPRDALCGAGGLSALATGARVGTGSVRRTAQLRARRADLQILDLRGNVDTRLRRLAEGGFDAIVLALAGLRRLGREAEAGSALEVGEFVPAPGQGILALEGRVGDAPAVTAAQALSDPAAVAALTAERALVATLGASCHTPLGAHARALRADELELSAFVGLPDGSAWVSDRLTGFAANPRALGRAAGERMLAAGAGDLLRRAQEMALESA